MTPNQVIRIAYNVIDQGNRMDLACRDWRAKTPEEKTWLNFKIHFQEAHLDLRTATTTKTAGFHANAVTAQPTMQDAIAMMANMAEASMAKNSQMAALKDAIMI